MPNWVFNELTVSGSAEDLAVFKEEIAKPYTTHHWDFVGSGEAERAWKQRETLHESPISFWNAIAPTDLDAYYNNEKPPLGERTSEQIWSDIAEGMRTGMDWYNWNVRHWGVKWDACNAEVVDVSNPIDGSKLFYTFDTPWGIPEEAMIAMSAKYPSLHFLLRSQEEQGWGAEMGFDAGQVHVLADWDIPESHAENIEVWGECWKCDNPDYGDLYDDCPKQDLTENTENGSLVS